MRSIVAGLPEPRRALALAAYLRIADGLDYCHLQDVSIAGIRQSRQRICVRIRSGRFPPGLEVARRRSDLWCKLFPVDIHLAPAAHGSKKLAACPKPASNAYEAARRLLFQQYRTVLLNVEGALLADDNEALHDIRVAIRRARTVLRVLRKPLAQTTAKPIERNLRQLNRSLGTARDLDVWIDFLTNETVKRRLARHPRWKRFVVHQQELRRLQQATVRRHLRGPAFSALRVRWGRFLRIELPHAAASSPPLTLDKVARQTLSKYLRQAMKMAELRHSQSPKKLHRLRIVLRRIRYLSGFFGRGLGLPVEKLSRRVRAVEKALGDMRDVDLALLRILDEGPTPPQLLVQKLERRRQTATASLKMAWRRLDDPQFLEKVRRELDA